MFLASLIKLDIRKTHLCPPYRDPFCVQFNSRTTSVSALLTFFDSLISAYRLRNRNTSFNIEIVSYSNNDGQMKILNCQYRSSGQVILLRIMKVK
jgi:hypothetical protein